MPPLASEYTTLLDLAKTTDPSGKALAVVNIIESTNELDDIPCIKGNLDTGELSSKLVQLPTITKRKINEPVKTSKPAYDTGVDSAVNYEGNAVIDYDLLKIAEDKAKARLRQSKPFLDAMSKERAVDLFYGKPSEGSFKGFAEHYNKLSDNCLSAGGTGNALSSAFLIGWSPETITTFYPKNAHTAGIESLPSATAGDVIVNAQGGKLYGYSDYFKWMTGLSVKNYRYGVRIANIAASTAGDTIINTIIDAISVIPTLSACNPRLYVNRKVWAMFLKAAINKTNTNLTVRELENHIPLITFLGLPVKKIDVLRNDEAAVA